MNRRRGRGQLPDVGRVERHTQKDLARMLWTKYLRPVDLPGHEGFDATAAIAGDTGMGKSEMALSTAVSLSEFTGAPFTIKENVVYTRDQLNHAIRTLPRYSAIVVDEAVNVLFSRDDHKNSTIIKVLEACRSRNLAIFFCMPDFSAMDAKARKSRIRFWIDIRKVGEGIEFIRKRRTAADPHRTDPWNNWAFDQIGNRYERHPNFIGYITWDKIPDDLRAEYNAHKHSSELLSDELESEEQPTLEGFLVWLGEKRKRMPGIVDEAASYLNLSPQRVYQLMRAKRRDEED